ncbi:molecular chaperone GrpE [Enterococcus lemanii]|nr:molecular chaperone GrpE [Enterococcus lemanii]
MSEKEEKELVEETPVKEVADEQVIEELAEEVVSETEELQKKLDEMEDKFLRASAEMANIVQRNRNERELLQRYRSQDLGKNLLPVIDNLERALAAEVTEEESLSLKKGVEMVLESVQHALKEEGIEEIPAKGEVFDPNVHQAVQTIPATEDYPTDTVVEVLQKGYKLHDRVLRASMVIVAQ